MNELTKRQAAVVHAALRAQLEAMLRGLGNLSVYARAEEGQWQTDPKRGRRLLYAQDRKAKELSEAMRRLGFPVEEGPILRIWLKFRDEVMSQHEANSAGTETR